MVWLNVSSDPLNFEVSRYRPFNGVTNGSSDPLNLEVSWYKSRNAKEISELEKFLWNTLNLIILGTDP